MPRSTATGANPLTHAAAPLLSLAGRLADTVSHPDPKGLSQQLVREIQTFEASAINSDIALEIAVTARYVLCSLLDEIVLNTPWGSQSEWPGQTLLSIFHKEAWGGEKFFQILERLQQHPAQNIDLLELMFICLAMGFEGKYRHNPEGALQLDNIRRQLSDTIRSCRGNRERTLSPNWEGVERTDSPLTNAVPFWALGSVAAGIAVVAYLAFVFNLNSASDAVAVEVAGLGRNLAPLVEQRGFIQPRQLTLRDLLQTEADRGLLDIVDSNGRETVILRALFDSGSADIRADNRALLASVAQALDQLSGPILVTGHTDNVPSRSLRFPSNWHLSKSRAESVAQFLGDFVRGDRISAEPRADSDPLVANDSPQNRATNRRVEISLFANLERGR